MAANTVRYVVVRTVAVAVMFAACGQGTENGPTTTPPPTANEGSLVPTSLFGVPEVARGAACKDAGYRQFDFWVGAWGIRTPTQPAGSPATPSVVESILGGCAVTENYFGGRGRSLNFYDAGTRRWTQHYVFFTGGGLLMDGAFERDSMKLAEFFPPPGTTSTWVWTHLTADSVKQHQRVLRNDGSPAGEFDGRYRRVSAAGVPALPGGTQCAAGPHRGFDFLLGEWTVYEGATPGTTAAGQLTLRSQSNGCLMEETMTSTHGYRSLAYANYLTSHGVWVRTFADDEGHVIVLRGAPDVAGTRLVLLGDRPASAGQTITVRVTWEKQSDTRVGQTWEASRDGGATFTIERQYSFVRR